jgi:ABC-type protease/lipase transport system fused ATPase/permease subunit
MPSDYLPEDLKRVWRELASNPVEVSPDELRREARKLRSSVRLRNSIVVGVCCVIVAAYGLFAFLSRTILERIGSLLSIAGTANVIVQFLKRPARHMQDSGTIESIRFYRAELERHRDFHRGKGIRSWLLPFLPGPILFNVAFALDRPMFAPIIELQMVVFVIVAAIAVPLNLSMVRKYQRRIDALDASLKQ